MKRSLIHNFCVCAVVAFVVDIVARVITVIVSLAPKHLSSAACVAPFFYRPMISIFHNHGGLW